MTDSAAALSRVWWHGFRQLRSPHRHHDPAIAQRLLDAAAAEPDELRWTPFVRQPEPLLKV
jgi:hypothetical protein